ncbi:MAG: MipA/OmpV family protein [Gammaproteobacteria bacterium]|nr:MipA/OmpV family protein [Gammaproteobacteria bacterium]
MLRQPIQLALLLILILAVPGLADENAENANESRWQLGAALGYGIRSNPLVQSDDIPIVVDLDIAWFGEHFFFDNGDLGLTFADNSAFTASVITRINSDRVFFGNTDTRFVVFDSTGAPLAVPTLFKPPDRDYAIELGVEMLTGGDWGAMQLTAFHDISGTHKGYELYADYSFGWRQQRLYVGPSFGLSYKSAELNNYYWGVTPEEAGTVAFPYEAGAGFNWHARLMIGYQLDKRWAVSLVAEYEHLNDEASASPIVATNRVLGWFAGASYRFGR